MKINKKYKKCMGKTLLGEVEPIQINGKTYLAKIDTGADRNSICSTLVKKLRLGRPIKKIRTRSSHGRTERKVYRKEFILGGKKLTKSFSVVPRSHMKYLILIGKNTLKEKFLVDVSK